MYKRAFTIIELLIVVVVIAILATLTIVSYSGISNKARVASLQADLSTSSKTLKLYYAHYGYYPASLNVANKCATNSSGQIDTNYCLKTSSGNDITAYTSTSGTFSLTIAYSADLTYKITESSSPILVTYNEATGGTVTEFVSTGQTGTIVGSKYRVHTFTASGTFTVNKNVAPFDILVISGGGGGGGGSCGTGQASCAGGGGGSGGWQNVTTNLPSGANSVIVGSGGSYGGGKGGNSSISTITTTGGNGGSGATGGTGGTPNGYNGGNNTSNCGGGYLQSTINGTSINYAMGGRGYYGCATTATYGTGGPGAQRTGGDYPDGTGYNGTAGVVIVRYEIAP